MHRNFQQPATRRFTKKLVQLAVCALVWGCGQSEPPPPALTSNFHGIRNLDPVVEAFDAAPRGRVYISPKTAVVAAVGDYSLNIKLSDGLGVDGRVLVEFPKSWFPHPWPRNKPLQSDDSNLPHYVAVEPAAKLMLSWDQFGLNGKHERFRNLFEIRAVELLSRGSRISVSLLQTTAPYIAGSDEILVAIDAGAGSWKLHRAGYEIQPGRAETLRLTTRTNTQVGEAIELHATALDRFDNVASSYRGTAKVGGVDKVLTIRLRGGQGTTVWKPKEAGFYWPHLVLAKPIGGAGEESTVVEGNPIWVSNERRAKQIYWGDLHSHSRISKDGIGKGDFAYARDISHLDFYASTEHADDDPRPRHYTRDGVTPEEWLHLRQTVQDFHAPGDFVTLLGYECSLRGGHHNVYFRSLDGVPWPTHAVENVRTLWSKIEAGEALTIPHHTGKRPAHTDISIDGPGLHPLGELIRPAAKSQAHDWKVLKRRDRRTPAIEIYSSHGSSEHYSPDDPLSYENVRFSGAVSEAGPHYARDAWAAGNHLGVVAGSDNHVAHPGRPHTGLTAIMGSDLTREDVFNSLRARRSYGTTGERIILDFTVGGVEMGARLSVSSAKPRVVAEVLVVAPREITFVEVMSYRRHQGWQVLKRWNDPGRMLKARTAQFKPENGQVLYLRAELKDNGQSRTARAWSSPIKGVK